MYFQTSDNIQHNECVKNDKILVYFNECRTIYLKEKCYCFVQNKTNFLALEIRMHIKISR